VGKKKGWLSGLALLVRAVRAPFLAASAIPVFVGTSAALYETGTFLGGAFVLNLLGVIFLHCSANVANDYYDYLSGADPSHPPYPFHGGSQVIQEGLLTAGQVRRLFQFFFLLATACGFWLALLRGPLLLLPGLAGAFFGYFYTAPPLQFAYRGLGEITTGITFGPLAVLGTYYVQAGTFALTPLVASLPLGFLIAAVLFVNQFPDAGEDEAAGKRNLVVRRGAREARPGLFVLLAGAYVSLLSGTSQGYLPALALLVLLTLPLAGASLWCLYRYYDRPQYLTPASAAVVFAHTGTGILLTLGYLLSSGNRVI
jgi:1,4-dihydroxy-2-naphthoate octaprenyltransferase